MMNMCDQFLIQEISATLTLNRICWPKSSSRKRGNAYRQWNATKINGMYRYANADILSRPMRKSESAFVAVQHQPIPNFCSVFYCHDRPIITGAVRVICVLCL